MRTECVCFKLPGTKLTIELFVDNTFQVFESNGSNTLIGFGSWVPVHNKVVMSKHLDVGIDIPRSVTDAEVRLIKNYLSQNYHCNDEQ